MLLHEVPLPVSRASGKRLVTLCLIAVTLVLLGIPDEADLQPVMIAGLQSFSDGGDDVDDGDLNGKYTTLPAVFGVLHDDRVFGHYHLGGKVGLLERVNMSDSISPRGPPSKRASRLFAFSAARKVESRHVEPDPRVDVAVTGHPPIREL